MIDAHVHLDKYKLSKENILMFIDFAKEKKIDELYLLQHTNLFVEFMPIYKEMKKYNEYQNNWVEEKEKKAIPVSNYFDFSMKMKEINFPIKLNYGLEVCYFPESEEYVRSILKKYKFDFFVGSIHTIDGWAFSHLKQKWSEVDIDVKVIYQRYYEIMLQLVKSKLFTGLGHPNSLGCYGVYPKTDFSNIYEELAIVLNQEKMYMELSSGLALNYAINDLGINHCMLNIMKKHKVKILTASDAHKPENVGMYIKELQKYL